MLTIRRGCRSSCQREVGPAQRPSCAKVCEQLASNAATISDSACFCNTSRGKTALKGRSRQQQASDVKPVLSVNDLPQPGIVSHKLLLLLSNLRMVQLHSTSFACLSLRQEWQR
eukprot:6173652-Pleurochrysis_carterae.AAC.16